MTSRADAIGDFAQLLVDAAAEQSRLVAAEGPLAAAGKVHYPGHPLTLEALAGEIGALHGKRRAA